MTIVRELIEILNVGRPREQYDQLSICTPDAADRGEKTPQLKN